MSENKAKRSRKGAFCAEDISLFCSQMALILKSGIPLSDGVSAVLENIHEGRPKEILSAIGEDLERNVPFCEALKKSGAFPQYMVNMIEIGEKSGKLDNVLEALAVYYDREAKLRKSIRSAVVYPLILVLMMSVVVAVLVIKVLPIFDQVFRDLGSEMSGFASGVMTVGMAIGKYAFIVILALAVILLAGFLYAKTSHGSAVFSRLFSRFFLTRKLSAKIASSRFASVMSMMLSSGYSTDEALELVPGVLSNDLVAEKIAACRKELSEGVSFAEAVDKAELFPGVYGQMVSVGSKTGNLDSVMKKLAEVYDDEVDRSISRVVSVIEPTLVGILSVVIGAILLSVMLPLMGIMSSIG